MDVWRRRAVVLTLAATASLLAGCGPNDRLRDNYMGKPTPPEYRPIERDQYGNPVLDLNASQGRGH